MLAGELRVAAYADIGGLGTRQGPRIPFVWRLPNLLPALLPWLVVLVLLALPSNRDPRAWWIWLPLGVVALLGAALQPPITMTDHEGFDYSVHGACAAAVGLACVWLLGSELARRCRALAIALAAVAFAAVSLLAFLVGPAGEQWSDVSRWEPAILLYLVLFWVVGGLAFPGALNLTGRSCRHRFSRVRVLVWLPLWLWAMWLVAGGVLGCVLALTSGGGFEWAGIIVASFVLAVAGFAVALPYLILSLVCPFYRDRLKSLLRLPDTGTTPAVSASPTLSEPQVVRPL